MRYDKLKVGQEVLYSRDRTSSRDFHVSGTQLATVVALGVEHRYYAQGGFSGGGGQRTTGQGVRIRVKDGERVTLAAHLVELTEENRRIYETAQAFQAEKRQRRAFLDSLEDRFGKLGYGVRAGDKTTVFDTEQVVRLLEKLEAGQ